MHGSQLPDSEVYYTSSWAPFRPGENLDHRTTRFFIPPHYRLVSLPCDVGDYIQQFSHFLQAGRF